jgi:hypothetical protein
MKFMVTFTGHRTTHAASIAKFLKDGITPPAGFKILGNWHGFGHGYMLIEATDLQAVYTYAAKWAPLQDVSVEPVLEQAEAAKALQAAH